MIGEAKTAMHRALPRPIPERIDDRRPFMEHIYELRRRLMFVAASILFWSFAAYSIEQKIVNALLRPAHSQQFIYTSPAGGMNFLFRLCFDVGIAMSIPVIIYQILRYIEPLLKKHSARFILIGSGLSGVLAVIGMLYGYFWGLPAALNFLLHQFVTAQIHPLLTIQSYMSFVTVYMLGSAMLLQIPLLLICINRVKPIPPRTLFKFERHVIAGSFIVAMLMNPTVNLLALLFIAGPLIGMYQVGIGVVWYTNRRGQPRRRPRHVISMLEHDIAAQTERLSAAGQAQRLAFAATGLENLEDNALDSTTFATNSEYEGVSVQVGRLPQANHLPQAPQKARSAYQTSTSKTPARSMTQRRSVARRRFI